MKIIISVVLLLSVSLLAQNKISFENALKIITKSEVYPKLKERVKKLKFMEDYSNKNYVVVNAYEDHKTHIVRVETLKVQGGKVYILTLGAEGNETWEKVEQKK